MKTKPLRRFPKGFEVDTNTLAAGRYGTLDMVETWGSNETMDSQLAVQGLAAKVLSDLHPDVIPPEDADEINSAATIINVSPDRIRYLEARTGHDIIAVNTALEEQVSAQAATHINKGKTSADTTQPARALQLKASLEVIARSIENLRDIVLEKAVEWIAVPHMDTSHLYDALPTVAGRPFAHYGEMLQSGLGVLEFVYNNSIMGKWADATGNHHSLTALDVDGIAVQKKYCDSLGVNFMTAPAQVPGLEFEADILFVMARLGETMNNLARYVAWGRSDDVNVFINGSPSKNKGSSAMPHKDAKNGNPTGEEQVMSLANYLRGNLMTGMANCEMPYARNLSASSNSRINFEDGFKFLDHGIKRLSNIVYWLKIREERSRERVQRSYGAVTAQQVMTYLTDGRRVSNPMSRSAAHDLTGELATQAWNSQKDFGEHLLGNAEVMSRIDESIVRRITDPLQYVGKSKEIVQAVYDQCHGKPTLILFHSP